MAVPTITTVTPRRGYSGGGTLVEIVGTGFQLPADPSATDPAPPAAPATLEVTFDGVEATSVNVWSATRITCRTPALDPRDETTVFTADAGTDTFTAAGHALADGDVLEVVADAGGTLPAPLAAATAYYVVSATTNTFQLALTADGAAIDITTTGSGSSSTLSDGGVDVIVTHLDTDGVAIPGETVTAVKLFLPLRPNLSGGSHLGEVVSSLLLMLKRHVVRNVAWTTSMDYDEDKGVQLDLAHLAKLPGILLGAVSTPRSKTRSPSRRTVNPNDPVSVGDFLVLGAPVYVDVVGQLIGVAEDPLEVLALAQAAMLFFRNTPTITVACDRNDPDLGTMTYTLKSAVESEVTIAATNDDLLFFVLDVRVEEVQLGYVPGLPKASLDVVPSNVHGAAVVGVGKTAATITVGAVAGPNNDGGSQAP